MKVLVVVRLFSGLTRSLRDQVWQPEGVPAVVKLLEALTRDNIASCITVFTVKDRQTAKTFPKAAKFELSPIGLVRILPYRRLPGNFLRLELLVTECEQLIRCLALYIAHQPSAAYFSFANFMIGGIFARLSLTRTVLRVMGIFPHHRILLNGKRTIWTSLQRWFLRSPYSHVICTEEGSGAESVLPALLGPTTPFSLLLNGVDPKPVSPMEIDTLKQRCALSGRPVVLFLGRLEPYKGCHEFTDAVIKLLNQRPASIYAVIVGSGSATEEIAQKIRGEGKEADIRLIGSVPHEEVPIWYASADIYVSLNKHGNLSNANLEALAAGRCMILPSAQIEEHIDLATEELLSPTIVPRVDSKDLANSLVFQLLVLIEDPALIDSLAMETKRRSSELLSSWSDRIALEIELIRGTVAPFTSAPNGVVNPTASQESN